MSLVRQLAVLAAVAAVVGVLWVADVFRFAEGDGAGARPAETSARQDKPVPVVVAEARYRSSAAQVAAVGTGRALQAVTLYPETAGEVKNVLFEAGERVKQGTELIRLDDSDEVLAVELSRVRLKEVRQSVRRYEQAAPSGAVSAAEVDTARASVDAARIELSQAELALRRRTVRAPFGGVMGIPEIEAGDRVTESTALATLDKRDALLVDFEVPEAFAYGVGEGDELAATAWALPGERFTGKVVSMASRIDPDTRTLRVRARLPNEHDRLRSGMSFVIRIPIGGERLPSVPSVSVQWNREGAFVWRIGDDNRAERVSIDVRKRSESWVLVYADIADGDRIVVEGVQRLQPGIEVDIREAGIALTPQGPGYGGARDGE